MSKAKPLTEEIERLLEQEAPKSISCYARPGTDVPAKESRTDKGRMCGLGCAKFWLWAKLYLVESEVVIAAISLSFSLAALATR